MSILFLVFSTNAFSQAKDKKERKLRFSSDSEFSLIVAGGNSNNTSVNLVSKNRWPIAVKNIFKFGGHVTYATDEKSVDAKNWDVNLRYERKLNDRWGLYLGTVYEVDTFAGYQSRDNFDFGVIWAAIDEKDTDLDVELGYRWMYELDVDEIKEQDHKIRLYSKWEQNFTKNFGLIWWVELLPNLTRTKDYMLNTEPSVWVNVSEVLAFKFGYKWLYRGLPPAGREKIDFTTTSSLLFKI